MSESRAWIARRYPRPPSDLDAEISSDVGEGDALAEELLAAARERLDAALARPGRVRQSAFDLLAADALITYACEAVLESQDAMDALGSLFAIGEAR